MFLAGMAKVSIPATSSPTVIFRVDPVITPGVAVDGEVAVNVYIDADPGVSVVGWAIDIKVDPAVLKPGYFVDEPFPLPDWWKVVNTSEASYFLYDWCDANNWSMPNPTLLIDGERNVTAGTITDYSEGIKNWTGLEVGDGANGTGNLVTFYFTSLDQNAWSPIEITKAYYYTSWNSPSIDERVPDLVINGHYNTPQHDVAVTDISAPPNATVGDSVPINVSILNQGANAETFDLKVFNDTTLIENRSVSLASSASDLESFTWNTTGMDPGTYTITANATLATDVDLSNNMRNTTIELKSALVGDAAVTNVVPSLIAGFPLPKWIIPINVTVSNNGTGTISFNVTAYYGSSWTEIGTEPVYDLGEGVSTNVTFNWNISALTPCVTHNLKANITLIGDAYAGNDEKVEGSVDIRIIGDVNGIGGASVADMVEVDIALGSQPGQPNYNPYADVDNNGSISVADMVQIDIHLGEKCP
jgi:hypothetical protein